jgi:two-component system OmpR family sensor kinase
MRNSLQLRLSFWLSGSIVVVGLIGGLVSYAWAFNEAIGEQDSQLRVLGSLVAARRLSIGSTADDLYDGEPEAQIIIQRLDEDPPPAQVPSIGRLPGRLPDGMQLHEHDGHRWRLLVSSTADGERFAVAQQTAARDQEARETAWRIIVPLLGLVPTLLLIVRRVVRGTLAPVRRLSALLDEQREIDEHGLPETDLPLEIRPFVRSINRLLARLTGALDQQRRFVADAAHELRSPITALSLQADNLAQVALSPKAKARLQPLQEGLARTRALLDQLLSLARSQAPVVHELQAVDLAQVLREVVPELLPMAIRKQIDLGFERLETARVRATPIDMLTIARNAVGNALRYSPAGTAVNVRVFCEAGDAVLQVDDEGGGIPADQMDRVFDAFYRVVGSGETGSGLGLSIVQRIAQRLGGRVTLANIEVGSTRGLRFEYRQPAT